MEQHFELIGVVCEVIVVANTPKYSVDSYKRLPVKKNCKHIGGLSPTICVPVLHTFPLRDAYKDDGAHRQLPLPVAT